MVYVDCQSDTAREVNTGRELRDKPTARHQSEAMADASCRENDSNRSLLASTVV